MIAILVDDEKLALESLRVKLSHISRITETHVFSSPEDAFAFFKEHGADIAFLDISMAQMDGMTLASCLRTHCPGLVIIFVTGFAEYSLEAFRLHADGYLMKPVDEEDIERELDALAQRVQPVPLQQPPCRIRAQTFGSFELFVDERSVTFKRSKTKELLAYLIDRRGGERCRDLRRTLGGAEGDGCRLYAPSRL